ncbi:hypothetical protein FEE96_17955 [Parasedimentitalea maritima]|uniref:Uncharacterized protein n=2 Tax=Parasedimentitalea TaxID=2738399 RepID=A0A6L6WHA6_9RHOB|nr:MULTISPECIES: hypothetical protein [Zongyanglinia]KAE9630158.1 hypothetical protein GP644_10810 [Zongyanglinia marina]MVO16701.1 hypothetical protein [Zongyanglinia huanghaiensis]TLP58318.1 hypothetical protein FEE96_17955 [Zongyanglinia marina]
MTDTTVAKPLLPTAKRSLSPDAKMFLAIAVFLLLWALSVVTWGIPGLYMPAVAMVPVIFAILMLITRG